jgi:hypothetical protein
MQTLRALTSTGMLPKAPQSNKTVVITKRMTVSQISSLKAYPERFECRGVGKVEVD